MPDGSLRIALIGCGNIGADICAALRDHPGEARVNALVEPEAARVQALKQAFGLETPCCTLDEAAERADLLVECAEPSVVKAVVEAAFPLKRQVLVMSLGGLLMNPGLLQEARERGIRLRTPSGALCGLDGLRAALQGGVERVMLTTRKPPTGLQGAPYLEANGIDVSSLTEPVVVFEGNALEAVEAFPKNVNVAAALSLAGVGPERTQVRVMADPGAVTNVHEVEVIGAFGVLHTRTENRPSPRNPKSSYLASLSAIQAVREAAAEFAARGVL